jgi:hypothetical protein
MRRILVSAAIALTLASATAVSAQERRGEGTAARSPRVSAGISRPTRVSGEFHGTRHFGYRARGYRGYGYGPRRYYTSYGYRPYGYRSYGYAPGVYGYRADACDW